MKRPFSDLRWLLGCVLRHPANRHRRVRALLRFAWWQLRKRLTARPAQIRVGRSRHFLAVVDSPFSSMVVYTGLPEWDEMNFLRRILRPDDGFADIGANVGFYTVLASVTVCGPLLAFEASPRNVGVLRAQIALNQLANAEVFGTALSNVTGTLSFADSGRETGSIASEGEDGAPCLTVPCARLDDLLAGRVLPGVMIAKMDVEGCESLVLEGAAATLASGRISVWLFELNEVALRAHGSSSADLLAAFTAHGYAIHYWDEERQHFGKRGDDGDGVRENYLACRDVPAVENRLAHPPSL